MWILGSKLVRVDIVVSPRRAVAQKVVVRQTKTAASRGIDRFNCEHMRPMYLTVYGFHFGLCDVAASGKVHIPFASLMSYLSYTILQHFS
jgi:hypothetical protein